MEIKITGRNPENLQSNVERIILTASIICQRGHLPTVEQLENPQEFGGAPYLDDDKTRWHLNGANNDWANIRDKGEDFVVIEFNHRYDKDFRKKEALTKVILAFFDCAELMTYAHTLTFPIKSA